MNSRSCGTNCGLCCTTFSIPELNKLAGVRCQHLTTTNQCGIYEDRPDVCSGFRCGYLRNLGPNIHPGRLGVFIREWVEDFFGRISAVDLVAIALQDGQLPPKKKNKLFRRFMGTLNAKAGALRTWYAEKPEGWNPSGEESETFFRLCDDPGYGYLRFYGREWKPQWLEGDDAIAAHPEEFPSEEERKEMKRAAPTEEE